jgi:hypothetical protein
MAYGGLEIYYKGLGGMLGEPRMVDGSLMKGMQAEHCEGSDSDTEFASANGLSTTAATEWEFVVLPQESKQYPERGGDFLNAHPEWCRKATPLSEFLARAEKRSTRLVKDGHAPLLKEEVRPARPLQPLASASTLLAISHALT